MGVTNEVLAEYQGCRCQTKTDGSITALLVDAAVAAQMCGKSERSWRTWDALGLIPEPVRIGRSVLWRAEELREWVAAGCPSRQEWKDLQKLAQ
jgi:predicted DNA-binding transcriptional regulator AlpA